MPKINYKKGLVVVILIDLVLLGLVGMGGYRIVNQYYPHLISPVTENVDLVEDRPAIISLRDPGLVNAGEDFSLDIRIQNPNQVPIHIREIILPRLVTDSMVVVQTDPAVNVNNSYDVGEGYPFDFSIPAGKEKVISFRIKPSKMQSVNTELLTYTDNFIIPTDLQFVVAP